MSFYDEMIKGEEIANAYQGWSSYRKSLTSYIKKSCIATEGQGKPLLAIWGAGRSNDLDLAELSGDYKLVLIDRDRKALEEAVESYSLQEDMYELLDIPFWHIDYQDYKMFEAMLMDGVDTETVAEYLLDIMDLNNQEVWRDYIDVFDYSVAVGIHSQLNSRFAALLYGYRENYNTQEMRTFDKALEALNVYAVKRLNDFIYHMTRSRVVFGYEIYTAKSEAEAEDINSAFRNRDLEVIKGLSYIEGVRQLLTDLSDHNGECMETVQVDFLVWPIDSVTGHKYYSMELVTEKLIKAP